MKNIQLAQLVKSDGKYDLTIFSPESIDRIENNIFEKDDKLFLKCFKRNKDIQVKPEEIVRQLMLDKLINEYGYSVDLLDDISSQIVSGHFGGFDVKISRKGNVYSGYRSGFDIHLNETENETTGNIGNYSVNLEGGHKRYLVPLLLPPPLPIIPIFPPPE